MDKLKDLPGVGEKTAETLAEAGLGTLMSIAVSSPAEISSVAGISEKVARKLIKAARDSLKLGFETARAYAEKRNKPKRLSTGCESFDEMLGGGFESAAITEIYGRTGSGKTQMSHLITVRALMEDKNNKTVFIDSESTFRESRIKDFCEANGVDYDAAMKRIYVARSYNSAHQMLLVDELERILQKDNSYRVLVVDSLTSHFRSEFVGRGTLANRQQLLNKHLHQLLKIADLYGLVVIVTNQVQSDPGMMYGNPEKPIGGNILSHSATSIVYIRPAAKGTWFAKLVDSPDQPQSECNYLITKDGFEDVK